MKNRGLITVLLLLLSFTARAQFGPPPPPPPGLPIDGGIFVLALIGLYFGIKKLKR